MALFFLVALENPAPAFEAALSSKITAGNLYTIECGKWLIVSPATTSRELTDSLEVPDWRHFLSFPSPDISVARNQICGRTMGRKALEIEILRNVTGE